jgi:predicted transcriptional regulator
MSQPRRLGDLQLLIMRCLWQRGEATVAQVHETLRPIRRLALTTIATMLRKMEEKGLVRHRLEGRQFVYRPMIAEQEVRRSMIGDLIQRLFDGDAKALLNHLLTEGEIDATELAELQAMIAARQHRQGRGRGS